MSSKSNTQNGIIYIGTSGWSYPHWAKGVFYPRTVPTQDWLKYYASVFNTVEINSTFYRLSNPLSLERWAMVTPPDFAFAVKIWRRISHDLRLVDVQKELQDFYNSIFPLQGKIKVFLLQMPPSFIPDVERLDEFFQLWFGTFKNSLLAMELRNRKGFQNGIFDVMSKYHVSLCLEDYKGCEIDNIITTDWVYIRRHGYSGRYQGEYPIEELKKDADKIGVWTKEGKDVFVYFNNDIGGCAPKNAMQLLKLLKLK